MESCPGSEQLHDTMRFAWLKGQQDYGVGSGLVRRDEEEARAGR